MAVIRRQRTSFWDSIKEVPRDWILHLYEDYELMDWNQISEATSWPIALVYNGLFLLVHIGRQINARNNEIDMDAIVETDRRYNALRNSNINWDRRATNRETTTSYVTNSRGARWGGFLLFLELFMIFLSMLNTWHMISRRKTYQLRLKDNTTPPPSLNCKRVLIGTRRPEWARKFWARGVWAIWKRIMNIDDTIYGEIWELSMWTPPIFSRNLFCWCSPIQLVVMSSLDSSNWYYILPITIAISAQLTFIVIGYSNLVKDKQVLFGEVYNEYNVKFVNPRVFAAKRDATTSTIEDRVEMRFEGYGSIYARPQWRGPSDIHQQMMYERVNPRQYLPDDMIPPPHPRMSYSRYAYDPVSGYRASSTGSRSSNESIRSNNSMPRYRSKVSSGSHQSRRTREASSSSYRTARSGSGDFVEYRGDGRPPEYTSGNIPRQQQYRNEAPVVTQKIRDRSERRYKSANRSGEMRSKRTTGDDVY